MIFTHYEIVFTFEIFLQKKIDIVIRDQTNPDHCGQW